MRVGLLAVGDELLDGQVTDTATATLAAALVERGLRLRAAATCGDGVEDIVTALRSLAERVDAVVLSGGLGPTTDDRTREALARWAGVALEPRAELVADLRRWYAGRGRPVPEVALRQAQAPVGAVALANPVGSAPGLRLAGPGALVWAVPGVPSELRAMLDSVVLPELVRGARASSGEAVATRTVRVALAGESFLAALLQPVEASLPGTVSLSYLAGPGEVRIRATSRAQDEARAVAAAEAGLGQVREVLGDLVTGPGDEPLEAVVHGLLLARGATVAVAESLTGGLLGAALTGVPGSSRTFRGGMTAYATDLKASLLAVDVDLLARTGAVHPEVAQAMARGVRERLGATYGLATTGVAGPGSQDGHPAGTVFVSVAGEKEAAGKGRTASLALPGSRADVRALTVVHALDLLRRVLAGLPQFESSARP